ncbi:MAG: helix-hairpin-helix domain-containing protein [Candidatus Omnitrophota bacterium]|nr:helix-hairpin-helix domain-containing protein [Candidatus Omnitrophota bacterium]
MFLLTPTERKVIVFIGILILTGSLLRFANKNYVKPSSVVIDKDSVFSGVKNRLEVINVNTASKDELTKLPGIGDKTAALIIKYRFQYGAFSNFDDLKKIKGIGDVKAERIKKYVVF